MAASKNGNGIHGSGAEDPPAAASPVSESPTAQPAAARSSRISSRPGRAGPGNPALRAAAREQDVGEAIAADRPARTYSFGTVVTAGLLGFVLGRLFTR
ncbi:hypothetical protein [Ancylobacter sp. TS-1]|uniref:hypothetical protein n=1 Tax=Ancylobacter sp. TS-1 TaxID=1850374 RepID=UPI001265C342|nr:hypothetical protein [Ancylobacter sp. TS-1]QFR32759.1 hypothetical protein GBB76_06245 [Ancylobacter sp. TS-1]